MNKLYLLLPLTFFVISCASTTKIEEAKIDYLDLSSKENAELVENYWSVVKRFSPKYPISAAKNGISGCADLIVGIDKNGNASGYKVRSSYPQGIFDKNAAAALNKWKWQATAQNAKKQPVLASIKLNFTLTKKPTDTEYLANCS